MKFVCMCQGGNVRSVGMAFALKYPHQQDAIACGWEGNTEETRNMLFEWADRIIIMQGEFARYIPDRFKEKLRVVDVGPDRYGSAFHPDLQNFVQSVAAQWKERNFDI